MWSRLMSEGKFWNGEATQKVLRKGSQEITNEAANLAHLGYFVPNYTMKCCHSLLDTVPLLNNNKTSLLSTKCLEY